MQNTNNPCSLGEVEYRFQELRAQRARARQLFHCYAEELDAEELDETSDDADDIFYAYYADDGER